MLKWLLFVLLAVIAYRLLTSGRRSRRGRSESHPAERMLGCAHCGVHLPESEALVSGGQSFCCEQHRQSWMQSH